jgi:hypothetical protein
LPVRRSAAKRTQNFLVGFRPGATLFDQAALLADLEAIFGSGRVDLVSEGGLLARDDHIVTAAVPA